VTLAVTLFVPVAFAQDAGALAARLKGTDPIDRTKAACEIAELGNRAESLIPQLAGMLGDATAVPGDVCGDWGRWWKGKGNHGAVPETTPGERAAQALVSIGIASVAPLVESLRAPVWHARRNAAWALGALDDQRAVDPLIAALRDTEPPVRRNAAWALGALDDSRAVRALVEALKDTDAETRARAAWALGALDGTEGVPGLITALRDNEERVRAQAAWALGAIGDSRAAGALATALKDPDVKVRRQAAWALGTLER
jgi:hypothetical protein